MARVGTLSHTQLTALLEEFCSALNIPAPRYQDWSHEGRGFTSRVVFGNVDMVFGKSKCPRPLQESRGEAARRALQWIDRLGVLPRCDLEYGSVGANHFPPSAYRSSFSGAGGNHQSQILTDFNSVAVDLSGSQPSSSSTSTVSGLPTLLQEMRSPTRPALGHTVYQAFQRTEMRAKASPPNLPLRRAQTPSKASRRPTKRSLTGGPTSSAANAIPLKRRRLPEKPRSVSKEDDPPALSKQGLLSQIGLYKEKVYRVAALCDYLSISHPEYIIVDENQYGVRVAAQFPATEVFLNRVGRIGLTGFIGSTSSLHGREIGREMCAGTVEAFLMGQVENGTFELQEDEGCTQSRISTIIPSSQVTDRVKFFRIADINNPFLDVINGHITATEPASKILNALDIADRPRSPIAAGTMRYGETTPLITNPEPVEQHSQISLVNGKENIPIMIKVEPISPQLDVYNATHEHIGPPNATEESIHLFAKYDEVVSGFSIERANTADMVATSRMMAQMTAEANESAPVCIKQEVEILEIGN